MNKKTDVFEELESSEEDDDESSAAGFRRAVSTLDIVDSIQRAAFRRRIEYDRAWRRSLNVSEEPRD